MMPRSWTSILRFALAAAWALAAQLSVAQEIAPDTLMKAISDEVIAEIRRDRGIQAGDPDKIAALVEAKILPHFDFRRATRIAMGMHWRRATPQQQDEVTRQFKTLLVRTYSGALASYRNQAVEFRPLRAPPEDTEVTVQSQVKQPGAEPVLIEYDLWKSATGWKVYDVRVAGISLVATYRSAFAEEVRNRGIDGLIEVLSAKNRRGAARPEAVKM